MSHVISLAELVLGVTGTDKSGEFHLDVSLDETIRSSPSWRRRSAQQGAALVRGLPKYLDDVAVGIACLDAHVFALIGGLHDLYTVGNKTPVEPAHVLGTVATNPKCRNAGSWGRSSSRPNASAKPAAS